MSNPVLENIRTRRVVREMTAEPVDPVALAQILEAGRWSPHRRQPAPESLRRHR